MTFEGLSKDEKATRVRACLSVDKEITLQQIMDETGLTTSQVHDGIRHLRENTHCVVTSNRGPDSTYHLAKNEAKMADYALKRMKQWRGQISVIRDEMKVAEGLFPGSWASRVARTADAVDALMKVFVGFEEGEKELQRDRAKFEREMARAKAKNPRPWARSKASA